LKLSVITNLKNKCNLVRLGYMWTQGFATTIHEIKTLHSKNGSE